MRLATVEEGLLSFPGGMRYQALVMPPDPRLSPELAERLVQFVEAGLTLIGPRPDRSPSLSHGARGDERVSAVADSLWGNIDGSGIVEHRTGRGRVLWSANFAELLARAGILPDLLVKDLIRSDTGLAPELPRSPSATRTSVGLDRQGGGIVWNHRRLPEGELYFVSNQEPFPVRFTLSLPGAALRRMEAFDPVVGLTHEIVEVSARDNRTETGLSLPAGGSLFVLVNNSGEPAKRATVSGGAGLVVFADNRGVIAKAVQSGRWSVDYGQAQTIRLAADLPAPRVLNGPWEVRFPLRDAPERSVMMPGLVSWLDLDVDDLRFFAGTATYRTRFDLPQDFRSDDLDLVLNLGVVENLARVRVNGSELGIAWTDPYTVALERRNLRASNLLEIEITNTWHNHVLREIEMNPDRPRPRSFSAPRTQYEPAGLLGPVFIAASRSFVLPA